MGGETPVWYIHPLISLSCSGLVGSVSSAGQCQWGHRTRQRNGASTRIKSRFRKPGVYDEGDTEGLFQACGFLLQAWEGGKRLIGGLWGEAQTRAQRCADSSMCSFPHFQELLLDHSLFCKACFPIWGEKAPK